jgi:hypothetical protein
MLTTPITHHAMAPAMPPTIATPATPNHQIDGWTWPPATGAGGGGAYGPGCMASV